jgi:hypothetical protein
LHKESFQKTTPIMKNKILVLVFLLFFAISAFAKNSSDITFVSYEQSWLDYNGTLALKNNTTEEIHNIKFLIVYLDMEGNELDYEEYERYVTIAPGMTKKIDIPAYEHSRSYHYYKSKDGYGNPAFNIKFELKDYNTGLGNIVNSDGIGGTILTIITIVVILCIGISIGLYVLVAIMAKKRHRNVILWVLLSVFVSPIITIIILLVVGEDKSQIENFE